MRRGSCLLLLAVLCVPGTAVRAQAPGAVSYQGLVLDPGGAPRVGPVDLLLMIVDPDVQPPAVVYSERHDGVPLVDGVFQISIGTGTEASGVLDAAIFASPRRQLVVSIDDEELAPAQAITSVPYALRAAAACQPGDRMRCYTAAEQTLDVGACRAGERVCGPAGFGDCEGESVPALEVCNLVDDDCDGAADEGVDLAGCVSGFADADGDGYGSDALGEGCFCDAVPAGGDCDDADPAVSPSGGFSEVPRADGSFDFNCDGVETPVSDQLFSGCSLTPFGSCGGSGWEGSVPACGEAGTFVFCSGFGTCNVSSQGLVQSCI